MSLIISTMAHMLAGTAAAGPMRVVAKAAAMPVFL